METIRFSFVRTVEVRVIVPCSPAAQTLWTIVFTTASAVLCKLDLLVLPPATTSEEEIIEASCLTALARKYYGNFIEGNNMQPLLKSPKETGR